MVSDWTAALLTALRLGPALAFAPPFTLLRVPATMRVLLAIGLGLWLVGARPELTSARVAGVSLAAVVAGELLIGIAIALGLQVVFGAILWAGRAVDVQAGFGLATLADPTTRSELPLVGSLFAHGAAMVFFATGAHYDLLALWVRSVELVPLGSPLIRPDVAALGRFVGLSFVLAVGLVGATMLAIFLVDLVIAFLSRTLPQMNVLLLGFQVKAMVTLVTLPISIALGGALFLRLVRMAVEGPGQFWSVPA